MWSLTSTRHKLLSVYKNRKGKFRNLYNILIPYIFIIFYKSGKGKETTKKPTRPLFQLA